ncbi:hypothetical protein DL98DRAFT_595936 [Cadophora sp. DSE1049]|nr:hypothetical protein DL98DRAFT_595936 [Cadophora sp. DSE1049]
MADTKFIEADQTSSPTTASMQHPGVAQACRPSEPDGVEDTSNTQRQSPSGDAGSVSISAGGGKKDKATSTQPASKKRKTFYERTEISQELDRKYDQMVRDHDDNITRLKGNLKAYDEGIAELKDLVAALTKLAADKPSLANVTFDEGDEYLKEFEERNKVTSIYLIRFVSCLVIALYASTLDPRADFGWLLPLLEGWRWI